MELATFIGISITEFWTITPAELNIAVRSFNKRKEIEAEDYAFKFKNEQKALIYQAFLISRWVWQKRINIKKILNEDKPNRQMSDEELLASVKALNKFFSGEVISVGKE